MKTKIFMALAVVAALASSANADFNVTAYDGPVALGQPSLSPSGDYTIAPGLGNAGGFLLAIGGALSDSTINDGTEDIAPDLLGGSVLSTDTLTDNGGGSFNLLLTIESTGGDLAPGGFTDAAGAPLDSAGLFLGDALLGLPVDLSTTQVDSLFLDALFADGTSIFGGPLDISSFGIDITTGSLGLSFGAGSAGIGIESITLNYGLTKAIPEPTSIAVLSVLGLGLVSRRRR